MPLNLEQRMDALERQVGALADRLAKASPGSKHWRASFGLSKDDPEFDEMIRLGQLYRKGSADGDDCAHS